MTIDALKLLVRFYVYLMCFLTAVVLFFGSSSEPWVMRILIWLFFCLVIYRGLTKRYFMTESEIESLRKPFPVLYEYHQVTLVNVLQTIVAFFLLWVMTYTGLETYTLIQNPYANLIGFVNGLLYSFFFIAKVFIE